MAYKSSGGKGDSGGSWKGSMDSRPCASTDPVDTKSSTKGFTGDWRGVAYSTVGSSTDATQSVNVGTGGGGAPGAKKG